MSDDNEKNEQALENAVEREEAEAKETLKDPDEIKPNDYKKAFSVGQFKMWRKTLMRHLNEVLQAFQRDLVGGQVRLNLSWNAMNSVIRALVKKGLITEEDLRDAGAELMAEAKENLKKSQEAAAAGVQPLGLTQVPIEKHRDDVNRAIKQQMEQ